MRNEYYECLAIPFYYTHHFVRQHGCGELIAVKVFNRGKFGNIKADDIALFRYAFE